MAASEDAIRTRVLNHMNKDHEYDIKLYLIHRLSYPKTLLLPSSSSSVKLSDIQTTHIAITVDNETKEIPFNPPMNSLADSRTRVVEMTRQAEAALGVNRDMVAIKPVWLPPQTGGELAILAALILGIHILFFPSTLLPGGFLRSTVLKDLPQVADWMHQQVWWGYWMYVSLHVGETLWFVWGVVGRYWVVPGIDIGTAGLWIIDTLIHGYPAIKRWKKMVEIQKKAKVGKKDH
ncbi:hypothetical protein H072_1824 [Dactylellina haptotyla CBS 200.50]|uniref:DUF2470 domain-containing protein n=1 Tax=Dactylellina haptotyla (strain CBS 200.50) TaxID=1284197 RepID=S8C914_DACHA|nr:hypothetical protein H072_1824 [Dactylellina haptotyla CBS 200.50]